MASPSQNLNVTIMEANIFISCWSLEHPQGHSQKKKLSPFITQLTVGFTLKLQQPLKTLGCMEFLLMHLSVKLLSDLDLKRLHTDYILV